MKYRIIIEAENTNPEPEKSDSYRYEYKEVYKQVIENLDVGNVVTYLNGWGSKKITPIEKVRHEPDIIAEEKQA